MKRLGVVLRPFRGIVRFTRRTVAVVPELVEAILILPKLSRQLGQVKSDTANLVIISEQLERINANLEQVERNTLAVEQLAEVAVPLQGAAVRVGRLADRFPQRRAREIQP